MSERPDNNENENTGWHSPSAPQLWTAVAPEDEPNAIWKSVPALPAELREEPSQTGGWHRPADDDTTFKPEDELQVEAVVQPARAKQQVTERPEDLLAQILGTTKTQDLPRPEDLIPGAQTGRDAPVRPEDFEFPASTTDDSDAVLAPDYDLSDEDEDELDATEALPFDDAGTVEDDLQDALDALDDADDEVFSMSELMALQSLEEGAAQDAGFDIDALDPDDLSPAGQAALFNAARTATELIPADGSEDNTVIPGTEKSAEQIAAEMAAKYAGSQSDDADGGFGTFDTGAAGQESAGDYAARMAQQFGEQGQGNTAAMPAGTQPLNIEQVELAQQFRQTKAYVDNLRAQHNAGQMDYNTFQAELQRQSIQDNQGNWWSLGVESDAWYRYDNASGQWVEAQPPVSLDGGAGAYGDDVRTDSLEYLLNNPAPQQGYDNNATVDFGMETGHTPEPYPVQDMVDNNLTMVGASANEDYLADNQATIASTSFPEATIQSPSRIADDYDDYNPLVESAIDTTAEPPSYDQQVVSPAYVESQQAQRTNLTTLVLGGLFIIAACGFITVGGGFLGATIWYDSQADPYADAIAGLVNYEPEFFTARIMDANGDLIVELNSQDGGARESVELEEISPYLIHAILSVENDSFYEDAGVDPLAAGRAFLQNLGAGEVESGASTITQQIARNLVLQDFEVTANRKLTEAVVANRIASEYDKNFILNLYLNEFYFGNLSYGVEAASQFYFDKSAAEVNMAEAAMLAGLLSAPSGNDPVVNREAAIAAMRNSLRLMLEAECYDFQHGQWADNEEEFCINESATINPDDGVSPGQARLVRINSDGTYGGVLALQLAQTETRTYLPREAQFTYPHFVNFIQAQVDFMFGQGTMFQRGFTIHTTLLPRIQNSAEDELRNRVAQLNPQGVNTGAVMVTDPNTGAIRAMVGSPDFGNEDIDGQVDNTRTYQQPGSSIKPVVYTAALEGVNGSYMTPASILWDVPSDYNGYQPANFRRGVFYGPVSVRQALQGSYNVSAVKAYEFIGNEGFRSMSERLGLRYVEDAPLGLPSALGATDVRLIDMMKVYGTFANDGQYMPLYGIERITEKAGSVDIDVPLPEERAAQQVLSPQVAYLMQNILSDDESRASEFGRGTALTLVDRSIPRQNYVGAKTGTSNNGRDLWTMGFTSNAVVGVWLGTFDNSPTINLTGFAAAAPVWHNVMVSAIEGRQVQEFQRPNGVVSNTVCRDTGTLADANCANRATEIYMQSQPPPAADAGFVQQILVDGWSGLRANEWCPDNQTQAVYATITDPFALQWINTTSQGQAYSLRVGLPANLQAPPAADAACSQGMQLPTVNLSQPVGGQTISDIIQIRGQVSAPEFNRYDLEYASVGDPNNFVPISSTQQQQPTAGSLLGEWDTTGVPNGQYILRLAAYSNTGGRVFRTSQVQITNIPPTPTPAPTATPFIAPPPTLIPQSGFTPIPFDDIPTPTIDQIG